MLKHALGISVSPVWCTKIASRLVRTYTDRHGLKELTREVLGMEISKQQQSSDWGAETLTDAQLEYAASDVLHLHAIKAALEARLEREGRLELAAGLLQFPAGAGGARPSRLGERGHLLPFLTRRLARRACGRPQITTLSRPNRVE